MSIEWLYGLSRRVWTSTLVRSPAKPDRKIGAAVAPMMAMGRAMVEDEQAKGPDGLLANPIFR
jgi:hypothetical protein